MLMAMARLKEQVGRVLDELGVEPVSACTLFRSLGRCVERDYRASIQKALRQRAAARGCAPAALQRHRSQHLGRRDRRFGAEFGG